MRVLLLGCHCDDIELGCGATLFKHRTDWQTTCVTLSVNAEKESREALELLGCQDVRYYNFIDTRFAKERQRLWEVLHDLELEIKPSLVITQVSDEHQDHTVLAAETIRNFRRSSVIAYRSSIRNCSQFKSLWFEEVTNDEAMAKVNAIQCYHSDKIYMRSENLIAMLRVQGIYIEAEFAEAFDIIKVIKES